MKLATTTMKDGRHLLEINTDHSCYWVLTNGWMDGWMDESRREEGWRVSQLHQLRSSLRLVSLRYSLRGNDAIRWASPTSPLHLTMRYQSPPGNLYQKKENFGKYWKETRRISKNPKESQRDSIIGYHQIINRRKRTKPHKNWLQFSFKKPYRKDDCQEIDFQFIKLGAQILVST